MTANIRNNWRRGVVLAVAVSGVLALLSVPMLRSDNRVPLDPGMVDAGRSGFADLVEQVSPAVVNISVEMKTGSTMQLGLDPRRLPPGMEEFFRHFFDQQSAPEQDQTATAMGSGFIIDPAGYVVTNNHVVEGASSIMVITEDEGHYDAELVGRDPKTDLALLKIEPDEHKPLSYVAWGDSDRARVGDWVLAIGNPFGLGGTATTGIISARGRDIRSGPYDDFIQIDAAINRGNSGGPLFNLAGEVIGVNTAIYSPNGGSVGIGFAVPASMAQTIIDDLRVDGQIERGWLGVQIQPVTEDIAAGLGLKNASGALVADVVEDSPAEKAGVHAGDVIVNLDGDKIADARSLSRQVAGLEAGTKVHMTVLRGGDELGLNVKIGRMEEEPVAVALNGNAELGLHLSRLTDQARARFSISDDVEGVLVTGVDPGSAAARQGLRPGDVIVRAGKDAVSSPADVQKQVAEARGDKRDVLLVLVARGDARQFITLNLA